MKGLPDLFGPRMKVLFVGINPGLRSAALGHHFAGFNNRFWKLLNESGLVPEPIGFADDRRLPEMGLGLTNIVARPTRSCSELTSADYLRGRVLLERKIRSRRPKLVACIGVMVFRAMFDHKGPVECGLRSEKIGASPIFVLPNPSGRNAHYSYARMLEAFVALNALVRR